MTILQQILSVKSCSICASARKTKWCIYYSCQWDEEEVDTCTFIGTSSISPGSESDSDSISPLGSDFDSISNSVVSEESFF